METISSQCARLKSYLLQHGRQSTIQIRSKLNIMHPAGRIADLRKKGEEVVVTRCVEVTPDGVSHRIARYGLIPRNEKAPTGKKGLKTEQAVHTGGKPDA